MSEQLVAVLLGAGLALAAQLVVQLYVVPHVEARTRREDRWEKNVLALGELLTSELPDRAAAAKNNRLLLQAMHSRARQRDIDEDRVRELDAKYINQASSAVEHYDATTTRLSWLVKRVAGDAAQRTDLKRLYSAHRQYCHIKSQCVIHSMPKDDFDEGEFRKFWFREQVVRLKLMNTVEALTQSRPPQKQSPWNHRWRTLVAWRKKKVGAKSAT